MIYSEYIKDGSNVIYRGKSVVIDGIYDPELNDYASKEMIDDIPSLCFASIVYKDLKTEFVPVAQLQPLRHLYELSEEELIQLRRKMRFGSLYYSSYDNNYGIDRYELADVADSYLYAIENGMKFPEEGDTPENFAYYCQYCISI